MKRITAAIGLAAVACAAAYTPGQSPQPERQAEQASPDAREPRAYEIALEHNARVMAMPEEDKAWPIYARIHREIVESLPLQQVRDYEPGAPVPDELAAWLDDNRGVIDEIVAASERPHLGAPMYWGADPLIDPESDAELLLPGDEPPPLIEIHCYWMIPVSVHASLLLEMSDVHAERGETTEALACLDATQRMSEQIEGLWAQDDLERLWIQGLALRQARELALATDDDATLASLAAIVARAVDFRIATEGERRMALDLVERVYLDGGRGELSIRGAMLLVDLEFLRPNPALKSILGMIDLDDPASVEAAQAGFSGTNEYLNRATGAEERELIERFYAALHEMQELPPWSRSEAYKRATEADEESFRLSDEYEERKGYAVASHMLGIPYHARSGYWSKRSVTRAVISLKRHHLRHNTWPRTLDDLDDDIVLGPMLDGVTGEPIHYEPTERGAVLTWSPLARGIVERQILIVPEPGDEH